MLRAGTALAPIARFSFPKHLHVISTLLGCLWVCLTLAVGREAAAQHEPVADQLAITAARAYTWVEPGVKGGADVNAMLLEGPVAVEFDGTRLSAKNAVVWVTPLRGIDADQRRVEIALMGDATLTQGNGISRQGPRLMVAPRVRGAIRFTGERIGSNQSNTALYQEAAELRPMAPRPGQMQGRWLSQEQPVGPSTRPADTQPRIVPIEPVTMSMKRFRTELTPEGNIVAILTGDILLVQKDKDGGLLELQADRAVAFTPFREMKDIELIEQLKAVEQAITGVYLEGDVRITRTPARAQDGEQRLTANRAFYDFTTDRAVLTDVVLHTTDPRSKIPIIVRARMVRQLSRNEYTTEKAVLTSSSFHTPSYSIGASSTYLRQTDFENELTGTRTQFLARNATFNIEGLPVFWLPAVGGTVTERSALRSVTFGGGGGFGFGVLSEWGLFETLGKAPPKGLDAWYSLDYFSERGPAGGLDAKYGGSYVSETTLQPWSFEGELTSYIALDNGEDELGRRRLDIEHDNDVRGRVFWKHQHFLPDDWQVQLTAGYLSDPTFLEEWFSKDFRTPQTLQTSLYAKRQRDSEVYTFLSTFQPNDFVSTSEFYQEQFEIERPIELGYHRVGDSTAEDSLTFFSANSFSMLRMDPSEADLDDLGFRGSNRGPGFESPGIPAVGITGVETETTYRGDFRQELNWPVAVGQFRAVPYVVGRFTQYSESIEGGAEERLYVAAGLRLGTAFWRVDDSVKSRLFDLNRLRHVIEPSLNLYVSAQSTEMQDLLIYDEQIDRIADLGAISLAYNQRWQSKRGGPGRWRSVDVFKLNSQVNLFFNEPDEEDFPTASFRGIFYPALPEASIARDSVNVDGQWQVSDSFSVMSDVQYNLEEDELATWAAGFGVRQGRVNYNASIRHIGLDFTQVVNGNTLVFEKQDLLSFGMSYELTAKYQLILRNDYDLTQERNDRSFVTLVRRFDRFFASVSIRVDKVEQENAFFFNVWPEGFMQGGRRGVTAGELR